MLVHNSNLSRTLLLIRILEKYQLLVYQWISIIKYNHYIVIIIKMRRQSSPEKKQGFIVRKKAEKGQTTYRQHSLFTNHTTLNTELEKSPGLIRKNNKDGCFSVDKIDEEVYYNSDIYEKYEKNKRPTINYSQHDDLVLQVRKSPQKSVKQKWRNNQSTIAQQQKKKEIFSNIHGGFELQKYFELYSILTNLVNNLNLGEVQILKNIRPYIFLVSTASIDNLKDLKFIPNKRQIIKQSFAIQRQAILVICFCIAIGRYQQLKNYCSNLFKYALDSYLIILNLLTQETSPIVLQLFRQTQREYLKGKGFETVRSNSQLMSTILVKIAKQDPLFSQEFTKILQKYTNFSIKAEFYALLTFFSFYLHAVKATDTIPFLSAAPGPFIIDSPSKQYTLVIDFIKVFLDGSIPLRKQIKKDTLILRPYTQYFLTQMSKYFQIISFSDLLPIQCNKILSKIDTKKITSIRLFRYHIDGQARKKQAEKIGRDPQKMILLDTTEAINNDSLLLVSNWKGETSDALLAQICPLLAMIAVKKLSAIQSLRKIREGTAKNASLGLKYINCGLNL